MKPGIHPTWYPDAVVICACGNTWTTGSTKKEIHTDVCSKCHPFFTGEQRIVDTAGQVERFMKRVSAKEQMAMTQPTVEEKKTKKEKRRERKTLPPAPSAVAPTELPVAASVEVPAPAAPTEPIAPVEEMVAPIEEMVALVEAAIAPAEQPAPVQETIAPIEAAIAPAEQPAPEPTVEKKARARAAAKPAAKKPAAKKPATKTAKTKPAAKKTTTKTTKAKK